MTASKRSILIINPNSTVSMTDGLRPLVQTLGFHDSTTYTFFTGPPAAPPSINNERDAADSTTHCFPALRPLLAAHDAFLVACYSPHPLVAALKAELAALDSTKPVTGIFEASVATALQAAVPPRGKFGIVSTGKVWEGILEGAVVEFLGLGSGGGGGGEGRFAGTETTGLMATELHEVEAGEVKRRMVEATRRLVGRGDVGAVCLGCAGMAGMNEMVREACMAELGEEEGKRVVIVDGVQAGVAWLEGMMRIGV
ncbi:hydantoin racemase [Diplodia corticola]|uniref:Hydantoin racemase n=1 Tax=Diplodia corticola TaxID=236234 RepID=A0A1J9QP57_9PEZI|nr:hydantoin racemase [Diplodia corticola]OJD30694.1 hydantoin racemase [Diplodia corticola]